MPGPQYTKMQKKEKAKPSSSTSSQQRTLFQTWGAKITSGPAISSNTPETDKDDEEFQPSPNSNNNNMDGEDEDRLLLEALDEIINLGSEIGKTSFEIQDDTAEVDLSSIPDLPGFNKSAGLKWIYPTNFPVRGYQFDIVKSALFQNTLVALPTGLGKTFIAAVLMFNFYRWYPLGKIVFMAPTKPLVTQQIEACYNIMGIPQSDIAEMTGKMLPVARQKAWKEKRVIFLTPQVLINDLSRGTCEAAKMKCLVVDEAHKSLGNYAYCQVVQELVKITRDFRILALSATPGSKIATVQEVISNLLISHIELRTEDSPEIKMYSFERKVEKIVVPLGEELKTVETQYVEFLESIISRLVKLNVLYRQNVRSLSKFIILKYRDEFRQNAPPNLKPAQIGVIEGDFALSMSLYHGYELLQLHGLRPFYQYLHNLVSGEKGYGRTRSELIKNANFMNVYDYLINKFGDKPSITFTQQTNEEKVAQYIIGHPKLEKLQEIVLEHFRKFQKEDGSSDTRIIIFSQYRNSVSDIAEMLKKQQPLVKVISFMGQAAGKETKGFTQKEQLEVMKAFREGSYNTLVSTCVGEEGLDIGDVDLIVCFDASKCPIRLVQRMGRTGRKRDGRIVMLVTEGKEDKIYKQGQYKKNSINKALLNQTKSLHYYQQSPRMLPDGLVPQCHKMYITVKKEFETLDTEKARKKQEKKMLDEEKARKKEEKKILDKEKARKKQEKQTKVTKGKTKTITDLMLQENSMDERLTPVSHSNSPLQRTEFQPIDENSNHFIGLDTRDNSRTPSPTTYLLLSDDDLPDLSPVKNICHPPKKAPSDTNFKRKSNPKTTKKRPPEKGNLKTKKGRKEEPPIDLVITIPDDYNTSDFVEETEPACNLKNSGIKTLFKSEQEPPNSTKSKESSLTKNNPMNNCLVPVAPSIENISNLLDDLKAQEIQKSFPNLSDLSYKWDEEFNKAIKQLLSSKKQTIFGNLQTGVSGSLASSSVAQNDQKKMDCDVSLKQVTRSPELGTISPQQNIQSSNYISLDVSHGKEKHSPKNVDSSRMKKDQNLKASFKERNEDIVFIEKEVTRSPELGTISPQQNIQSSNNISLDVSHGKEKHSPKNVDSPRMKKDQNLHSSFKERNEDIVFIEKEVTRSPELSTISRQQNIQLSNKFSAGISHDQRKHSPKAVDSPRLEKDEKLKSAFKETNENILSIPLEDYSPEKNKTLKNTSSMETAKDNSKLATSYGDLFADFSQSFEDVVELEDKNSPSLEKSKDASFDPKRQNLETSPLQNSSNSDIFNEDLYDDDCPVFDLTTDIFSEDNLLDSTEAKSVSITTPTANPNHIPKISSDTNPSSAVASDKSSSALKLSSLIVSFVNTNIPTSSGNGCTNTEEDEEDLPLFDLEFDLDAIPPTPEPVNPHSLSSKDSQSKLKFSTSVPFQNKVMFASESHSVIENNPSAARHEECFSLSSDEELGGFHCVLPSLNVIGHLQQQSTPFSNKKATLKQPSSPHFDAMKDSPSLHQNKEESLPSSFSSGGFDLKFDELLDDVIVIPDKQESQRSTGKPENVIEDDNNCDSSDDSFLVRKKKRVTLKSPSPVYQSKSNTSTNANQTMEDEDSFCVRKRKKAAVLTSPLISSLSEGEDRVENKTLKTKESHSRCKRMRFLVEEENSPEDFVKEKTVSKRRSVTKTKSGDKNRKLKNGQFDGRHFLDEEAELSGSDDEDGSDEEIEEEDHYEQSFINDLSQVDRTQNVVDMRAVYLRSVVSPVVKRHGFKMNYRNHNVSDVYSCPPEPDEDYEHDSFCVESAESSFAENLDDESSFEIETPKAKKKNVSRESKKRRVIRPETSSEEEEEEEDIFPDVVNEPSANVSDCDNVQRVDLVKDVKENSPISKEGSSSVVVTGNKDCDASKPLVIFADSREIVGAQDIISDLRIQHKLNVIVTKLEACDYIVSVRTAVERKLMSDFVNGANCKKLVARLQEMCEYYERPCLIVENNPQKGQDKKNIPRPMPQTKYLETLLSQLSLSPIRLLFSSSKLETCSLLASLCCQENAKGMAVCRNQTLSDSEQQKMKFFLSLPKVNYALALNMCKNYKNIKEFLLSPPSFIVERSKMSSERAAYLHKFIRQMFNL